VIRHPQGKSRSQRRNTLRYHNSEHLKITTLELHGLSIALGIIALAGLSLISSERGVAVINSFSALSLWTSVFGVRLIAQTAHQMPKLPSTGKD